MIRRILSLIAGGAAITAAAADPPEVVPDAEKIYPYVVPEAYLAHGPSQPDGIARPLGHDLYIVLVHDLDGMVRNVLPEDLKVLGLNAAQAQATADRNLGEFVTSQTVTSAVVRTGPQGKPFALFCDHWAAATVASWTGLHKAVSKLLQSESLIVSIPHRDVMLVLPDGDDEYVAAIRVMVREKESDGVKPLTWGLFTLTDEGLQPREK